MGSHRCKEILINCRVVSNLFCNFCWIINFIQIVLLLNQIYMVLLKITLIVLIKAHLLMMKYVTGRIILILKISLLSILSLRDLVAFFIIPWKVILRIHIRSNIGIFTRCHYHSFSLSPVVLFVQLILITMVGSLDILIWIHVWISIGFISKSRMLFLLFFL